VYNFVRAMTAVSAVIFRSALRAPHPPPLLAWRPGSSAIAIAYSSVLTVVMLAAILLIQWLVGERRLGRRAPADPGLNGRASERWPGTTPRRSGPRSSSLA
jgi:iron(III) transport system permease protein